VPELPEVETIRLALVPALVGRRVASVRLLRPDICTPAPGAPCSPAGLLRGQRVRALDRRGKQLAIIADRGILLVHLGMTGSLSALGPGQAPARPNHLHAIWTLDDGRRLVFRDPRRFGGLWPLPGPDALAARWATLGPDALRISGPGLRARCGASARPIKAALLDQAVTAGIGNIYADEALFASGIHPATPAASLGKVDFLRLASAIRATLRQAIRRGGSTIRDYVNSAGQPGTAQTRHAVYGRSGKPCLRCQRRLAAIRLAGRATVFCPHCQPRRKS
jgi:formamidopyrimidine-DNA glycosylase